MAASDFEVYKKNLNDIEDLLFQMGEVNPNEVLGKIYNCLCAIYSIIEPN